MKSIRKLIPAIVMLLVSLTLATSSTYAWFSMNKQVSATGMEITAKSESVFLLISETHTTADDIQEEKATLIEHTVNPSDALVFPSAHEATTGTEFATVGKWYTANSDDPALSTIDSTTKTALTSFTDYVIHYTYYFTVADGSKTATNLRVSSYTITANNTATGDNTTITPVKTVVTCGANYEEFSSTMTAGSVMLYTSEITNETVVTIDVYIYYDGNNTNVFTNNIDNLDGATIAIEFSVT